MRKIIQIAVTTDNDVDIIYALCEDGTLWSTRANYDEWAQQHPIPVKPVKVGSFTFTEYGDGR